MCILLYPHVSHIAQVIIVLVKFSVIFSQIRIVILLNCYSNKNE